MRTIFLSMFFVFPFVLMANNEPINDKYSVVGAQVQKVSFYESGAVKEQGYFLNEKLHGTWVSYNEDGSVNTIAFYDQGKKVGIWSFFRNGEEFKVNFDKRK